MKEELTIRPYARLLTMLGEQLIKNGQIALVELIKNSYDADASFVKVSFMNFNDDFTERSDSYIVIEDDGNGMNETILKTSWLNPATPQKLKQKRKKDTTDKGRKLQGEKGIGRFAIFKLGKKIEIVTRRQLQNPDTNLFIDDAASEECVLKYDFSKYDNDFLSENGEDKDLYLDDLKIEFELRAPQIIVASAASLGAETIKRKPYGTRITIRDLNTKWNENVINRVSDETMKLQPLLVDGEQNGDAKKQQSQLVDNEQSDFKIFIYRDSLPYISAEKNQEKLKNLLEGKSVFAVSGDYNETKKEIHFLLNNHTKTTEYSFDFTSPEIQGLSLFKNYFKKRKRSETECGSFNFKFYIFDLDKRIKSYMKYTLDDAEEDIIKNHRIYLYRDNIRVMPYGDPDDDWLRIDIKRGTESASSLFSNDQVVGFVYITQKGNPKLRDKTNREGLIEEGFAYEDLITVIQLILRYLRAYPYKRYLLDKKNKQERELIKSGRSLDLLRQAKSDFKDDKKIGSFLSNFERTYKKEYDILFQRITRTENLAAVGLSVQTASHDTRILLNRTVESFDNFMKMLKKEKSAQLDYESITGTLKPIQESLRLINSQMTDLQRLFPSTKTRKTVVDIESVVRKIYKLYKNALLKFDIECEIKTDNSNLMVTATDAVFMQVFINLFDNSMYWLQTIQGERKIFIEISGKQKTVVFSDNGPGIKEEYEAYIFEAFFSGKGEEGKGLGLYIAQQLLDRYGFSIRLDRHVCTLLDGATFVVDLSGEKDDE